MPTPRLTDVQTLKHILNKHGVHPNRTASQNFLICEEVVEAAVLGLDPAVTAVTELGAGLGTLTQGLIAAGFTMRAIERDARLAKILPTVLPAKRRERVEVVVGDLREVPWSLTPVPSPQGRGELEASPPYSHRGRGEAVSWQLAGNIPYHLSGLILRRLTQLPTAPARTVLLMQQEVGERLVAGPGEMSLLSLAVQLWGEAHELMRVPPHCFWPSPQVTSMLVLLVPHEKAAETREIREAVLQLAKPFFQGKRKQLGGTLRRHWGVSAEEAERLLAAAEITPTQRPQELSVEAWQRLLTAARETGLDMSSRA